jgi:hypothetical protein
MTSDGLIGEDVTPDAYWNRRHEITEAVEKLYHYTTAPGLLGILEKHRLWATNVRYLNDPSEGRYAVKLVQKVLQEASTKHEEEVGKLEKRHPAWESLLVNFGDLISYRIPKIKQWTENALKILDERDVYVSCLCPNGNLLSQWRGYGALGGGYALGFDPIQLQESARAHKVLLRRVIYKPEEQGKIVQHWVDRTFELDLDWRRRREDMPAWWTKMGKMSEAESMELVQRHLSEMTEILKPVQEGVQALRKFLAQCLICFKDEGYSEEHEWRLIYFAEDAGKADVKFREQRGAVVPYVELDVTKSGDDKLPARHLFYGPTLKPDQTEKALKLLLKARGYEAVTVEPSGIPFAG